MTNRTIAEFISYLNSLDVQLFIEGDASDEWLREASSDTIRLRCTAPEGTLSAELRQELTHRKAELISYLRQEQAESRREEAESREAGEGEENSQGKEKGRLFSPTSLLSHSPSPLSFAQQRLWFLYQLAPDNPFYNVPAAIRLQGTLNVTALERSFQEIVRRHAVLRTTFTTLDGQSVQVVEPDVKIELAVVSLQTVAASERERISQQLATAEAQRPFNLTTDRLLRVTLLQFDSTQAVLLLTMHHIVADGWSLGVLIRELACFYTAFVEKRSPALPHLSIQYADFARWQCNWLQGEVLEEQLTYWRKQLHDLPLLHLPSDRPRPAVQTYRGATYPLQISPALTQSLEALSQQTGATLFMILLAAFQTLLYRYTGQEDIAVGSPIANRHRSELEGMIGFFVNSLVMRSDLSGDPTFRDFLGQVRDVALEAYEHQDLPFEKLVEELDPDRDLSRNPLFQVAFALQNAPMQRLELPGLTLEPAPLESGSTRFDLEIHLWEPAHGLRSLWQSQEGLSGFISYSTDLFDRDRIARLVGHLQTLLAGIVASPDARLSEFSLLTPAEQDQILIEWNCSLLTSPKEGNLGKSMQKLCFHEIFEAQAQAAPEAIAIVWEQESLTYGELNQQADRLAQTLRQMGVQTNSLVGLCVDRSADMVIGILGILKAGGAYVPLDLSYPGERLQFMMADTQFAILLTQSWLVASLPTSSAKILCLDQPLPLNLESHELSNVQYGELESSQSSSELGNLANAIPSDRLAYVIYTSGSTGTPKGVLLTHRGLCNVVAAQQQLFHLSHNSRILQFSSLSFDASIFEIALALGCGGRLYIPPRPAQLPGMELVQFLEDNAITHALLTPAVLSVLPSVKLPDLQVLITGGEACSSQVIDRWAANRHFFNAYGPTEVTIWATTSELHPGDHPLTIGRPIFNTQVYILDTNLNPVPAGIPGELYIGGEGVAYGYLNRPELTAERFVENPFGGSGEWGVGSGEKSVPRLYRTGDRAQYRSDGTIEFLGRVDYQIKIRGFRVELGEIEATLQRHPAIRDVVVLASNEPSSEMHLSAYFSLNLQHLHTISQSLQIQHVEHWQTLYDQTYQSSTPHTLHPIPHIPFNTTGWNSSYTGEPIPLEQMQEWVSDRVQQILALKPKRVLEIGCGTGLLLFQLAPHCQNYVGTDFSPVSLQSVQQQLNTLDLPHVKLLQRTANDFEGIELASFDVVILNSIVQYFPNVDYLMQVLQGAIRAVIPGGVLFVGDVRSLPLLTAFHTWTKFCQADAGMERTQLQQQVNQAQFEEPELAIDPMFFYALCDRFSQIQQVQLRLARGRSQNEMTQFRYNVLLHIEDELIDSNPIELRSPDAIKKHDWKLNPITAEEISANLFETKPEILIITNVTNNRITAAVKTANWLHYKEAPQTVGQMRDRLQELTKMAHPLCGIDPQDWWDLETVLPYTVEIAWSTPNHTGDYDVLLIRQGVNARVDLPLAQRLHESWHHYTNNPLQSSFTRQLIPELRQYLKQTLPNYMVPSAFIPLEMLPLTVNGKVDRASIAEQYRYTRSTFSNNLIHSSNLTNAQSTNSSITPLTSIEATLVGIWQELLRLKRVNVYDNFFELGGHSLLATQMTSRIRDTFGLEMPLKNVFESPTIAQLAPILESLRDTAAPKMPPLVRLDRSAYHRKRLSPVLHSAAATSLDSNPQIQNPKPQTQKPYTVSEQSSADPAFTTARSPLVPLTLGGSKPPFFCVHPMFGVVFPYLELAHHLGSDRSFYGLQPLGLDGKLSPLNRMEAIAAHYIQAIQTLQPHGPYFLGGWSFGGLVAFEMAQQLTQAGQQVELLAMLDTPAPCNQLSFQQTLKFLLGTALWSVLPFLLDYGAIATNRLQSSRFSRWQWSTIARLIPEESRLQLLDESAISPMLRIFYANAQAAYRYAPQPYFDRITLFKAIEQPNAAAQDATLGWSALANDIQLHQVPGNHLSFLKQPHVRILAQQLGHLLS